MELAFTSSGITQGRISRRTLGAVLIAHAGVIFLLASQEKILPSIEAEPIVVSLIAPEVRPAPIEAPKALPVKPAARPTIKKTEVQNTPTSVAPIPQLATAAAAPEPVAPVAQKTATPHVEEVPAPTAPAVEAVAAEPPPPVEEPIEQPRFNADYLDNPAPAYPPLSRKLREEGRVLLRVRVDTSGHPAQVTLHASSGFTRLDERAADTVRRWKFQPARQGGLPVEAWVIVPIQFSLKG